MESEEFVTIFVQFGTVEYEKRVYINDGSVEYIVDGTVTTGLTPGYCMDAEEILSYDRDLEFMLEDNTENDIKCVIDEDTKEISLSYI
jgi:hypothetical protein